MRTSHQMTRDREDKLFGLFQFIGSHQQCVYVVLWDLFWNSMTYVLLLSWGTCFQLKPILLSIKTTLNKENKSPTQNLLGMSRVMTSKQEGMKSLLLTRWQWNERGTDFKCTYRWIGFFFKLLNHCLPSTLEISVSHVVIMQCNILHDWYFSEHFYTHLIGSPQ